MLALILSIWILLLSVNVYVCVCVCVCVWRGGCIVILVDNVINFSSDCKNLMRKWRVE
jgi:hypothetical protein